MDSPDPLPPDALDERRLRWRALLLLLMMALILTSSALYLMWVRGAFEATQPLYLTTDDSDGVLVGMDLTFAGFPIGRVRKIELVGAGTVLTAEQVRASIDVGADFRFGAEQVGVMHHLVAEFSSQLVVVALVGLVELALDVGEIHHIAVAELAVAAVDPGQCLQQVVILHRLVEVHHL